MTRIGGALLIFLGLISVAQTIYLELDALLLEILTPKTAYLVSNLLYGAMYLASFMVPVAFFARFSKGKRREPMRLSLKLTPDTPFLIFGSIVYILPMPTTSHGRTASSPKVSSHSASVLSLTALVIGPSTIAYGRTTKAAIQR